jgi:hypothetical protein
LRQCVCAYYTAPEASWVVTVFFVEKVFAHSSAPILPGSQRV